MSSITDTPAPAAGEVAPAEATITLTPVAPTPAPAAPETVATAAEALKKGVENQGHGYLYDALKAIKDEFEKIGKSLEEEVKSIF